MRSPHDKLRFCLTKEGVFLLVIQYRFYSSEGVALQVPTFQTQTYLHLIKSKRVQTAGSAPNGECRHEKGAEPRRGDTGDTGMGREEICVACTQFCENYAVQVDIKFVMQEFVEEDRNAFALQQHKFLRSPYDLFDCEMDDDTCSSKLESVHVDSKTG